MLNLKENQHSMKWIMVYIYCFSLPVYLHIMNIVSNTSSWVFVWHFMIFLVDELSLFGPLHFLVYLLFRSLAGQEFIKQIHLGNDSSLYSFRAKMQWDFSLSTVQ